MRGRGVHRRLSALAEFSNALVKLLDMALHDPARRGAAPRPLDEERREPLGCNHAPTCTVSRPRSRVPSGGRHRDGLEAAGNSGRDTG